MKNFYLFILIITLFIGCGKNPPSLPASYENVSFNELMEKLELKRIYYDNDSAIYESRLMDSEKYKNSDFYNYNRPMNDYCTVNGGNVTALPELDKLQLTYLKEYINYSTVNTFYCRKDNNVLFTFFKEEIKNSWKAYPQYKYYFVNSKILSNEVNKLVSKKEQEDLIKAQNEEMKLNNDIQLAQNKAKLITNKIELIKNISLDNSKLSNYEKNNFKDTDGVYYFSVISKINKLNSNKIELDFDDFVIYTEKQSTTEKFTNKVLNTIETKYRFKVQSYRNDHLIATTKFRLYSRVFEIKSDSNLDNLNLDVIVGFKNINNPDILKRCNDSQLTGIFIQNEKAIKEIKDASCFKTYSYDATLYNIIVYDRQSKQIVFYAINE